MAVKSKNVKKFITPFLINDFRKDYRSAIAKLVAENGRNFALRGLVRNLHFFTDPKFIERVLYSHNLNYPRAPNPLFDRLDNPSGRLTRAAILDRWRRCKTKILNQAFTETAVKKYTSVIVGETARHLEEWEKKYGHGDPLVPYGLIQRLASRNLQKGLLGNVDLDMNYFIETVDEFAKLELKYELSMTKLAWKFPTSTLRRTKEVMKKLSGIHDIIIKHCLREDVVDVTVFKDIVKAYKSEYQAESSEEDLHTFLQNIAAIYTIAGFDSLSHAMPVAFAYLSTYPDVAEKIRAEVKRVVGDGEIKPEHIDSLAYTKNVFLESQRISGGIFPLLIRQAVADDNIDGYVVKKGDKIILPVHYMTHLPEFWENPEGFNPERFESIDTTDERYRYVHLTFGAGLTACLGRHFAVLQCVVILAMTMRKFRLDLLPYQTINSDAPEKITMQLHKL